jgi:hypothetical protein
MSGIPKKNDQTLDVIRSRKSCREQGPEMPDGVGAFTGFLTIAVVRQKLESCNPSKSSCRSFSARERRTSEKS